MQTIEPTTIPTDVNAWIATLPVRDGWGKWDSVGGDVYSGVQNWSVLGEAHSHEKGMQAIGIWGIVTPYPGEEKDGEVLRVEWSIYEGNNAEPVKTDLASAEAAMAEAERIFPQMFSGPEVGAAAEDAEETVTISRKTLSLYRRLADGLSDMIEGSEGGASRLGFDAIPDDYEWLVGSLAEIAAADPS